MILIQPKNDRTPVGPANAQGKSPSPILTKFKTTCRVFAAGILGMLLVTACSEQEDSPVVPGDQQQAVRPLSIIPHQGDLIEIKGADMKSLEGAKQNPDDLGRFEITLEYVVPVTDRQREVFEAAAERWQRIIIKDVPAFTATGTGLPSAFTGTTPPLVAAGETVDDIVIEVALAPIDGPGGILGQAGPRFVRTSDFLTLSGVMFFDVADLQLLEDFDLFEEVIVHEMGHVLGIGTLWGFPRTLIDGTAAEPYFTGKKGNIHWKQEGGTGLLPMENMGGGGTRFSHWRESVLDNELMTGFLNLGYNPLSRITAGSVRDLGYGAAIVGDQYDLPKGSPGVEPEGMTADDETEGLNIAAMETLLEPVGIVTVE